MGDVSPFGQLRALAGESVMQARAMLAHAAGLTFGGARDLYKALGYKRDLSPSDYFDRFERGDIAARVVEAKPEATWRGMSDTGGAEIIDDDSIQDQTAFEQAFTDMDERLDIWSRFYRTDVLAGATGEYAVLFICGPGDVSTPLPHVSKPELITLLQPFGQTEASFNDADRVRNQEDPRFGLPEFYKIKGISAPGNTLKRIHHTRLVHVPSDIPLASDLYGQARLKRIWNRLDDIDKVAGGGSEAFWNRANQGTVFNMDPSVKVDPTKQKEVDTKMSEELDEFMHGMRRFARLRGIDVTTLGSDTADFKNPVDALISLVSAATGIPQRILMGSERGELASSQDATNWNDRIRDRRRLFAEPFIVRPFVRRMIACGALPAPKNNKFIIRWPDGQSLDMAQRITLAVSATKANAQQGETVFPTDEIRDKIMGYPPLTAEQKAASVTGRVIPDDPSSQPTPSPTPQGDAA